MKPLSIIIHRRRLTWFGHLMHLPAKMPARKALHKSCQKASRKAEDNVGQSSA